MIEPVFNIIDIMDNFYVDIIDDLNKSIPTRTDLKDDVNKFFYFNRESYGARIMKVANILASRRNIHPYYAGNLRRASFTGSASFDYASISTSLSGVPP